MIKEQMRRMETAKICFLRVATGPKHKELGKSGISTIMKGI
jgi:hypothetical protein